MGEEEVAPVAVAPLDFNGLMTNIYQLARQRQQVAELMLTAEQAERQAGHRRMADQLAATAAEPRDRGPMRPVRTYEDWVAVTPEQARLIQETPAHEYAYADPGYAGRAQLNLRTPEELRELFRMPDNFTHHWPLEEILTPGDTALPSPTRNLDLE